MHLRHAQKGDQIFYSHFELAEIRVFHYLEQPIAFSSSQSVRHSKLSTVYCLATGIGRNLRLDEYLGAVLFENDQCTR